TSITRAISYSSIFHPQSRKRSSRWKALRRSFPELTVQRRSIAEGFSVAMRGKIWIIAVAEKLSALRTEERFRERRQRANLNTARRILKKAGKGKPPLPGDELR